MAIFFSQNITDVKDASLAIAKVLADGLGVPREHCLWQYEISSYDPELILCAVQGLVRIFFKSRDCDYEFIGIGAADIVTQGPNEDLSRLVAKTKTLFPGQVYFGAKRFDQNTKISQEWQSFGHQLFILPLIFFCKHNGRCWFSLNYRFDGCLSFSAWRDHTLSLLNIIAKAQPPTKVKFDFAMAGYLPSRKEYSHSIECALLAFAENPLNKKVVIGRRNSVMINGKIDPAQLFFCLQSKSRDSFLFFFDAGKGAAFFGVSPELLYCRRGLSLVTESLAGTRPRADDLKSDAMLREELFDSFKDCREHELVSLHVEEKLKEFGTTDLFVSKLEVMALPYVQHLLKRYFGTMSQAITDAHILQTLHPTPAVCGLDINWARQFIRQHENFDRGFYAGPIGYIGKDEAEFAVAIRSALFNEQQLYIYAACGIVPGSIHEHEWEELNNKEKNILSIFASEY